MEGGENESEVAVYSAQYGVPDSNNGLTTEESVRLAGVMVGGEMVHDSSITSGFSLASVQIENTRGYPEKDTQRYDNRLQSGSN